MSLRWAWRPEMVDLQIAGKIWSRARCLVMSALGQLYDLCNYSSCGLRQRYDKDAIQWLPSHPCSYSKHGPEAIRNFPATDIVDSRWLLLAHAPTPLLEMAMDVALRDVAATRKMRRTARTEARSHWTCNPGRGAQGWHGDLPPPQDGERLIATQSRSQSSKAGKTCPSVGDSSCVQS